MKISPEQVFRAIESASESRAQYYDTKTGETVYLPDPDITGERDEALAALLCNEAGRFFPFPTQYEIHAYSIMADFVDALPAGRARQELAAAIRGKGAFRRFKQSVRYFRLEKDWYSFQEQAYWVLARRWCREYEFEIEEPPEQAIHKYT